MWGTLTSSCDIDAAVVGRVFTARTLHGVLYLQVLDCCALGALDQCLASGAGERFPRCGVAGTAQGCQCGLSCGGVSDGFLSRIGQALMAPPLVLGFACSIGVSAAHDCQPRRLGPPPR